MASRHQSTRLHLLTRTKHIVTLMETLTAEATEGDEDRLFATWHQVKVMIRDVKSAVKVRRRNSVAFIQRLVRGWNAKATSRALTEKRAHGVDTS